MTMNDWLDSYIKSLNSTDLSIDPVKAMGDLAATYWRDGYDSLTRYEAMDSKHLRNCYLFAIREGKRTVHIPYLAKELINRGFLKTEPELFI